MAQRTYPDKPPGETEQAAQDVDAPDTPDNPESTVCARCGETQQGRPLTWTCSVENHTRRYFCNACARTHLRSIEGRLDSAWW